MHPALPTNLVYQALSIKGLATTISASSEQSSIAISTVPHNSKAQELLALVAKYTSTVPPRPAAFHQRASQQDVVLLTGSTGGFGSHILVELVADPSVEKVFLFNRGPGSRERQLRSLQKLGLDAGCLSSPKLVFLEGDLGACMFGLGSPRYKEVCWNLSRAQSILLRHR